MTTPLTPPNPLTLVMPLSPGAEAKVGELLASQQAAIDNALSVVGTVHFARFVLFDAASPNLAPTPGSSGPFSLAVITTYDGDFDIYIQDFVAQLGDVFNALLELTPDAAGLVPVKDNVAAFTAWIKQNDLSQQPPNGGLSQYAAYPYTVQTILADCS
jgi:hypothetical protein